MSLLQNLENKQAKIAVVGLGYVGLPLAVLLAKKFSVIGLDINQEKITELKNNIDRTGEVGTEGLQNTTLEFTTDPSVLSGAQFIIVAVPTPVDEYNQPDLLLVRKASEMIGKYLQKGSIVVYESTVYPGVTEELALPILEKVSGFTAPADFAVGYSPERVNPGDKEHTIDRIVKVISAQTPEALEVLAGVYGSITSAGTFKAASIKVAEAAKVIENTQRDLNIALMNELALIFGKMDISVYDVLAAAGTKWNFLKFQPGLVGGHCIGVDPYYLTYKAQGLGHHPEVILAGRRINDAMGRYVAREIIKQASHLQMPLDQLKVSILGFTFKENVPDVRNSRVIDVVKELGQFDIKPLIYEPFGLPAEVKHEYGVELSEYQALSGSDVVVLAVAHDQFKQTGAKQLLAEVARPGALLVDVKHVFTRDEVESLGYLYWSL